MCPSSFLFHVRGWKVVIDTGLLMICSAARPCMALIYPLVYFKQSQSMSEGCVCRKGLYIYEFKRRLRTFRICLDLTHSFVFLGSKTKLLQQRSHVFCFSVTFNFHCHLSSTDTCARCIVIWGQFNPAATTSYPLNTRSFVLCCG